MHDVLIAMLVLGMVLSPCVMALFTYPMQGEDKDFVLDLIRTR